MKQKAFTIIETIVAVAVFAFAMGAISGFLIMTYRVQGYAFEQAAAIEEARKGIETMVEEIREANMGDDGSYIITRAEDFQFTFYSDIDDDGTTEQVRYFVDGTDFKKGVTKPTGAPAVYDPLDETLFMLSGSVRNSPPVFRYFDGEGMELAAPARLQDTKLMRVYLVVNVNPNRPPQDFSLESDVHIRNLKTNL